MFVEKGPQMLAETTDTITFVVGEDVHGVLHRTDGMLAL